MVGSSDPDSAGTGASRHDEVTLNSPTLNAPAGALRLKHIPMLSEPVAFTQRPPLRLATKDNKDNTDLTSDGAAPNDPP